MDNSQPLVSILIPTYNRCKQLEKAIESAINQTYKNIEIIISNNNSTDNTEETCLKYLQLDNRIKYYKQEETIKAFNNSNFLLTKFSGDFFCWLCDDDWLSLDYIEKSLEFIINNDDYSFVSPSSIFYNDPYSFKYVGYVPDLTQDTPHERMLSFMQTIDKSTLVNGVFRRSIIDKWKSIENQIFKYRYAEDCNFMLAYLAAGKGKCISNTHYNKDDTGATRFKRDDTPVDYWNVKGLNPFTEPLYLAKLFASIIKNDSIFKEYLSDEEIQKCSDIMIDFFYINHTKNRLKKLKHNIKNYIKQHPLFFTRKKFYFKINRLKLEKNKYIKHIKELETI